MAALHEVSVEFPDTKEYIEEDLVQKCLKENISFEEVSYFSLISKELAHQVFLLYCVRL